MSTLLSSFPTLVLPPALVSAALLAALTFYVARLLLSGRRYPPIVGTFLHQLLHFHRIYDYHTELSRRYRTYRILVSPSRSYVYTSDPANVEYILKTNFDNYGKGRYNYEKLSTFFGDGIFSVDGEKWRQQRKLASHEFSAKVLRDFTTVVFRQNAAKLTRIISDTYSSQSPFDLQALLMRSTLDSIFKVGFGSEMDTLERSYKEGQDFARAFEDASAQTLCRYMDPTWKIKRFLNVGSEAKLKKDMEVMDSFVYRLIRARTQQLSLGTKDPKMGKEEDILSRFLEEKQRSSGRMSDVYLKDIILSFIIAGRDSTAGTLAWFFYSICRHGHVKERIVQEVKAATGAEGTMAFEEFAASLTEEALSRMHYLHATLSETLRLYPAVPLDAKQCFSDDVLPDGYRVRKGDQVDYQPYAMGRMECLWGVDAEQFKPERWLDDSGVFRPESQFKFTAFQGGLRICLGKEFAYRQMKITAATLLYFLEFRLGDENMIPAYVPRLNLQLRDGLIVLASRR